MPLWQIYHPPGTFATTEAKQALVNDIVPIYTIIGLPAFYVVVQFHELPQAPSPTSFVGLTSSAQLSKPFIRIVITNIAVRMPNDVEHYRRFTGKVDKALRPHVEDKGYDWEYHVAETESALWKINGLVPPAFGSEEEKMWARENRAVEYPGAKV